jgi:hypothetical protein
MTFVYQKESFQKKKSIVRSGEPESVRNTKQYPDKIIISVAILTVLFLVLGIWCTARIPSHNNPVTISYPRGMYTEGDVDPDAKPMEYHTGPVAWDSSDRSVGTDLGVIRTITGLTMNKIQGYDWSTISQKDITLYYSDDNSAYFRYLGSFDYRQTSSQTIIEHFVIKARYVKIHQSLVHDAISGNHCVLNLGEGSNGSPMPLC